MLSAIGSIDFSVAYHAVMQKENNHTFSSSRKVTPIAIDMNSLPALAGRTASSTLETTVGLTEMKMISEPLTTGRFSTYVLAPNALNASMLAWSEGWKLAVMLSPRVNPEKHNICKS